ncbi:MAG: SAM-dependent methyltransferase [Candidatus Didemnitutus sp.]|nr:SAM-dependent methyltransferase [Candidatus Didemnitutus sp.]
MGSSPTFHEVFADDLVANHPSGATHGMSFARFMELAMYHPTVGYYTAKRKRVGVEKAADFYTATSFNPVFGELVIAACVGLLAGRDPADYQFIEIGAEPTGGILSHMPHPFASNRTMPYGNSFAMSGKCIVFSNELFDAQPFHRVVCRDGTWRELGVALRDGSLVEVELPAMTAEVAAFADQLPQNSPHDYHIDLPLRTVGLLERIIAEPFTGLFLAFDYGKTWDVLAEETPEGTGRTYSHQLMGIDLLDRPGEIDLTCHICWDWLVDHLQQNGFGQALVESQESFLARRAEAAMAAIVAAEAQKHSRRKRSLMQLLHPGNMGQKFQAMHALRE